MDFIQEDLFPQPLSDLGQSIHHLCDLVHSTLLLVVCPLLLFPSLFPGPGELL